MGFFASILAMFGVVPASTSSTALTAPARTGTQAVQDAQTIPKSGTLTQRQVELLAQKVTSRYFPSVSWRMLVAMAYIESTFNASSYRNEYNSNGSLRDTSYGLMQILVGTTGPDIFNRLGARAYGYPTAVNLRDPETSLYYGAAYVNWLRKYGGKARSAEFILRAYNGGPGYANSTKGLQMTATHWSKYQAAYRRMYG